LPVSSGIAIGPAHIVEPGVVDVPEYRISPEGLEDELARFVEAVAKGRRQLRKLKTKALVLPGSASEELGFLLDAHMAMLTNSRLTRGVERRIREENVNAEAAVQAELTEIARTFSGLDDIYIAGRMADVREVGRRLIRNLLKHEFKAFSLLEPGSIILAEELTPADTALLDPRRIAGFATSLGGAEGHTAIMARSLGIPAVLGIDGLFESGARNGATIVVDGVQGRVWIDPPPDVLERYAALKAERDRERESLRAIRHLPAETRDGKTVSLLANLDLPRDIEHAIDHGAEGVGLLRTEFLFLNRADLPDEEEQYAALRAVMSGMGGRPVTARTIDIGGDKLPAWKTRVLGSATNPALGLRAIRLSLREPRLLETQFAAMLRASAHGPLNIMLPMISSLSEVTRAREILMAVAKRLKRRGVPIADPLPPLGIMVEIPAAALAADSLAGVSDFFSIGTNDLTQYTLAIDRGDDQVAELYDPLHPSVLKLIRYTVDAALRARIPVSVCGEIAGDPRLTALLVGLGVRSLSMSGPSIPAVKRRIRALDLTEAARLANTILDQADSARIAALLGAFNTTG
jgi:phosphoenolpyruvate-protein phosphotransferase (PTS system enzyme I)